MAKRGDKLKKVSHIDDFRTPNYRVFYAGPYFNLDLWYEITWNKKHLKKLKKHAQNPHLFHKQFHDKKSDDAKKRHFREHVIDSIPFHEKILDEHQRRLDTILELMPLRKYKKIVGISIKHGGTPEFFVYDKINKEVFFVVEHLTDERKKWIKLVRKLCDVIILK